MSGSGIQGNSPGRPASASLTTDVYTVKIEIIHLERRLAETHADPVARYDLLHQIVLLLVAMVEGMGSAANPLGTTPGVTTDIGFAQKVREEMSRRPVPMPPQPVYKPLEFLGAGGLYTITIDPKDSDSQAFADDLDRVVASLMNIKIRTLHVKENLWLEIKMSELHGVLARHRRWHIDTEFHHEVTVYDRDKQQQGIDHQRDLLARSKQGGHTENEPGE